ncbi:MAG: nucleotidyl transferase AbiEii/AbiGii toxin family protein [Candidatus Margulisiibacteriota bacterium]
MIAKHEIMTVSQQIKLRSDIVEKEYVLGWLLAGINQHPTLQSNWLFKGGTCLKKCFFETYRFSEDLDFTIINPEQLAEPFLKNTFQDITEWIYEQSGIQFPKETIRFEVFTNTRSTISVEGYVGYIGPLQRKTNIPRVKLDLTADEKVVEPAIQSPVHHPYTDNESSLMRISSYSFIELFAEKIRALAERARPRDLYDVIHCYRHRHLIKNYEKLITILEAKCTFKGIEIPSFNTIDNHPNKVELSSEWENMMNHQVPILPPLDTFWDELPGFFSWLESQVR